MTHLETASGNLQSLDTQEAVAEFDYMGSALSIVKVMDQHLETGGRVNVADKNLLNCQADLNQLVPFKYGWLWDLYLTSCSKHWMPQELSLDEHLDGYLELPLENGKFIYARAWVSNLMRRRVLSTSTLLTFYRLFTNPEARQYILRQVKENTVENSGWDLANEVYGFHTLTDRGLDLGQMLARDNDVSCRRFDLYNTALLPIKYTTFDTKSVESIQQFCIAFIGAYFCVNILSKVVDNAMGIAIGDRGIVAMLGCITGDMANQLVFFERTMQCLLDENPSIITNDFITQINQLVSETVKVETMYLRNVATKDNLELENGLKYLASSVLNRIFGLGVSKGFHVDQNNCQFVASLLALKPKVNESVSVGGGALGWDD